MFLDIVSIVVGIFVVLKGADFLTDGAVSLAQRAGIPEMVIGLTVVALGTSMPELFVSLTSAIQGTTDLAVANVVGSNIFNVLLIAGTAAAVAPMTISKGTVRRDIPVAVGASLILLLFGVYGEINRWAGALFVILLIRRALDDTLYPADDFVAVKGEEIHDITAVVVDKAFLEHSLFVTVQRRDKVGTVLV